MTAPFRDVYAAALDRAAGLAEENEELRDEVARLRGAAPDVERAPSPEPESPDLLTRQTLDRLEKLSEDLERRSLPRVLLPETSVFPEERPRPRVERVDEHVVHHVPIPLPTPETTRELTRLLHENAELAARLSRAERGGRIRLALVCVGFALAFVLGYLLRSR